MSEHNEFSWMPVIAAGSGLAGAILGAAATYLAQLKMIAWQRESEVKSRVLAERERTLIPLRSAAGPLMTQLFEYGTALKEGEYVEFSKDRMTQGVFALNQAISGVSDPEATTLARELVQVVKRQELDPKYLAAMTQVPPKPAVVGSAIVEYVDANIREFHEKRIALLTHIEHQLSGMDIDDAPWIRRLLRK